MTSSITNGSTLPINTIPDPLNVSTLNVDYINSNQQPFIVCNDGINVTEIQGRIFPTSIEGIQGDPINISQTSAVNIDSDLYVTNSIYCNTLNYTNLNPPINGMYYFSFNKLTQQLLNGTINVAQTIQMFGAGVVNTDYVINGNNGFAINTTNHTVEYQGPTKIFMIHVSFAYFTSAATQAGFELRINNNPISMFRAGLAANHRMDLQDFNVVTLNTNDVISYVYCCNVTTGLIESINVSGLSSNSKPMQMIIWSLN